MVNGKARPGGFVSVTNVGMDENWMHHPMAMANLYGFGKLAWNPDQPLKAIVDTWTRLTWGNDPEVDRTIDELQLGSWKIYEGYTGPNGMGTLTNILGYHFGPGIESAERNGWGQWFRADKEGVGMDRTSTGTGYAQQYPPELAMRYESVTDCPEELLLFFHHVPYDFKLKSGKTLVQSIYDEHYASAAAATEYAPRWEKLNGKIDSERYQKVLGLFRFQAGHATVWRDAIDIWFQRISGIEDVLARVGRDPDRIEAESMMATGYQVMDVTPWETASGGKAVVCKIASGCEISTHVDRAEGRYDIAVQYFDTWRGASRYEVIVNGTTVAVWKGDDTLPPAQFDAAMDGQDSTRFTARRVELRPGDVVTVRGVPDLRDSLLGPEEERVEAGALNSEGRERRDYREFAGVDYLEITEAR